MSLFTLQTSDKRQYGPVELETLCAWAREGRIDAASFVYDHAALKWVEAPKLSQILDCFQNPPPKLVAPSLSKDSTRDPNSQTTIADPLTRAEAQVATQILIQRKESGRIQSFHRHSNAQKASAASSSKIPSEADVQNNIQSPSLLKRIAQTLMNPFSKKDAEHKS